MNNAIVRKQKIMDEEKRYYERTVKYRPKKPEMG